MVTCKIRHHRHHQLQGFGRLTSSDLLDRRNDPSASLVADTCLSSFSIIMLIKVKYKPNPVQSSAAYYHNS
jgi:hypothetical protein